MSVAQMLSQLKKIKQFMIRKKKTKMANPYCWKINVQYLQLLIQKIIIWIYLRIYCKKEETEQRGKRVSILYLCENTKAKADSKCGVLICEECNKVKILQM